MRPRILLLLGLVLLLVTLLVVVAVFAFSGGPMVAQPRTPTPTPGPRLVNVVVSREDIPAGTVIRPEMVLITRTLDTNLIGNEARTLEDVVGQVAQEDIAYGYPIFLHQLRPPTLADAIPTPSPEFPERLKAVPVVADTYSVNADLIQKGDRVDVIAVLPVQMVVPPHLEASRQILDLPGGEQELAFQPSLTPESPAATLRTAKTIVQDAVVLDVVKIYAQGAQGVVPGQGGPTDLGTEGEGQGAEALPTARPFQVILVLGLTDQQAEMVRYIELQRGDLFFVLRRPDDRSVEKTIGVTDRLLLEEFGFPTPTLIPLPELTPTMPLLEHLPSLKERLEELGYTEPVVP